MANMNVTYAEMNTAAAQLRTGKDNLSQELTKLMGVIDHLVGSGFQTDTASSTYHDTFQQFRTGTQQAIYALDGLSTYLDRAATAMQATDADLAKAIQH